MNRVLVFTTTVNTQEEANLLSPFLHELAGLGGWNFALDDRDRILRVTSTHVDQEQVIWLLERHGFRCIELADSVPEVFTIQDQILVL